MFAGSTRRDSFNKKLARAGGIQVENAGGEVTYVDLRDYPLPLYDGDLEAERGIPEPAQRLKTLFRAHPGLLIASPEYNSSISGVLKNTLDWVSRPADGEPPLVAFRGKVAALTSASPGGFGGMRGLVTVRAILGNIGVLVLPTQISVPKAGEAFAEDGSLLDARLERRLAKLATELVETVGRLAAPGENPAQH